MNPEIVKELGWNLQPGKIVSVAYKGDYRMYYDNGEKFTIQKCRNGFLECDILFTGPMSTKAKLKAFMKKHGIDVAGV